MVRLFVNVLCVLLGLILFSCDRIIKPLTYSSLRLTFMSFLLSNIVREERRNSLFAKVILFGWWNPIECILEMPFSYFLSKWISDTFHFSKNKFESSHLSYHCLFKCRKLTSFILADILWKKWYSGVDENMELWYVPVNFFCVIITLTFIKKERIFLVLKK